MKKTTLRKVAARALADPAFWRALRRKPEAALSGAEMELSADELTELKRLLERNVVEVDLDKLMAEAHRAGRGLTAAATWRIWRSWITWYTWKDR